MSVIFRAEYGGYQVIEHFTNGFLVLATFGFKDDAHRKAREYIKKR